MCAMSIFPLDVTRFPDLIAIYLLRWKRYYTRTELASLSDDNDSGDIDDA